MDTGNTVTIQFIKLVNGSGCQVVVTSWFGMDFSMILMMSAAVLEFFNWGKSDHVPDGKDTTSLGEAGLLLNTTDSLLQDGGNLGGSSLGLSSVGTDLLGSTGEGAGNSRADLERDAEFVNDRTRRPQRVEARKKALRWVKRPLESSLR